MSVKGNVKIALGPDAGEFSSEESLRPKYSDGIENLSESGVEGLSATSSG